MGFSGGIKMKRGTYRPRNSTLGSFEYYGGMGRDSLRDAMQQMLSDPARAPKATPVRRQTRKIAVHGKMHIRPLLTQ